MLVHRVDMWTHILFTLYDAHIVINLKSVLKYPPELWGACQVLQTLQRRARTIPLSAPCRVDLTV